MATFREIAFHSVDPVFSLYNFYFLFLVISCFVFEDRIWVLIVPVPGHCLLEAFIGNH